MGLIAERAFAAGFGNGVGGEVVSGSRAERYQVMLHVDADTLKEAEAWANPSWRMEPALPR